MPELYFRTNAKVERLVGRELITSNTIALFELIKNSYDAGAKKVDIKFVNFNIVDSKSRADTVVISNKESYIDITDTGKGMTYQEIKENWMELGTPNKEKSKSLELRLRKENIDTVFNRVINGEKGIGRFGVDKLGSFLTMTSIDSLRTEKTEIFFDWESFEDNDKLIEQIPCTYTISTVSKNEISGLKLKITNLRDTWTLKDLIELKRSLKKFLSPIKQERDEFRIFFYYGDSNEIQGEEIINDTFEYLKMSIDASLSKDGILNYKITDRDVLVEDKTQYFPKATFGEIKATIFYVDSAAKRSFTKKMGMRTSDYGNIKIFKDNFRVMPYGESSNDWLEIDKKHAQGFFRTFGTRDLVGYILLSNDPETGNTVLKEATDRVGLIEDVSEFEDLREFSWELIKILQTYVFDRFERKAKETTQILKNESSELKSEFSSLMSSFKDIVTESDIPKQKRINLLADINKQSKLLTDRINIVETASREIEKKIKVYAQINSKEGILFDMLHVIKNKLAIIDSQLKEFELDIKFSRFQDINPKHLLIAFETIRKVVEGALNKVSSSKLRKNVMSVKELIDTVIEGYYPRLKSENVEIRNIFQADNEKIRCGLDSLKSGVFDNLFDNSIKALRSIESKIITIETKITHGFVEILFSDNGIGVPVDRAPFVFSMWSSSTEGTGIGLATAKDIIEDHNGEILLVDLGQQDKKTTFLIKLPKVII